jgi:putative CocE/NonD family hydrolase
MAKLNLPSVLVTAEHHAAIPMRDGTVLRAEIYRRVEGTPFPVLLVRSPYGEPMLRAAPVLPAIEAGFAVVLQHCRGTGASDGEFTPFEPEADDGIDTIEWCAQQEWSDGRVAMWGMSYLGMVQLAAAVQAPAALRSLAPIVTPADYHWGLAYRQGAFQLGQLLGWYSMKSVQTLGYRASAGEAIGADMAALRGLTTDLAASYRHLPLRDMPAVSSIIAGWRRWLEHEQRDAYWQGLSYAAGRSRVTTPAVHVGGWFDLFLGGTLDNYQTLRRAAATDRARRNQWLVIGPWTHADQSGTAGELSFGPAASAQAIGVEALQVGFLRRFLDDQEGERALPHVKLFVMGDNVWRDEEDWPLPRTQWTRWYLHADGTLSPEEPAGGAGDADGIAGRAVSHFRYDPADPAPTTGGQVLLPAGPGNELSWPGRPPRPARGRGATRRAVVHQRGPRRRPGGDRPAERHAARGDIGRGRGLHGETRRRVAGRPCTGPGGRDRPGALPAWAGCAQPGHAGRGSRVHDRPDRDEPGVQGRAPAPGRGVELELPVLRPESGQRRARGHIYRG